eukprot:1481712-Prymnesium_polylepis.1
MDRCSVGAHAEHARSYLAATYPFARDTLLDQRRTSDSSIARLFHSRSFFYREASPPCSWKRAEAMVADGHNDTSGITCTTKQQDEVSLVIHRMDPFCIFPCIPGGDCVRRAQQRGRQLITLITQFHAQAQLIDAQRRGADAALIDPDVWVEVQRHAPSPQRTHDQ